MGGWEVGGDSGLGTTRGGVRKFELESLTSLFEGLLPATPPRVEFIVSSFYHRPKGDRRRRGNNDARPCRSSAPGLAPRAAGLSPRSPDGRQEAGRRLVRSHAALVDPEWRRRRFSPEFHVRWVLISTDVRSLFARPDSMLTLVRSFVRSFARSPESVAVDVIELAEGTYEVGREAETAEICLPVPTVSSRHALIRLSGDDSLTLTDLGSTNGTYVNGKELDRNVEYVVKSSDEIVFGDDHLASFIYDASTKD